MWKRRPRSLVLALDGVLAGGGGKVPQLGREGALDGPLPSRVAELLEHELLGLAPLGLALRRGLAVEPRVLVRDLALVPDGVLEERDRRRPAVDERTSLLGADTVYVLDHGRPLLPQRERGVRAVQTIERGVGREELLVGLVDAEVLLEAEVARAVNVFVWDYVECAAL